MNRRRISLTLQIAVFLAIASALTAPSSAQPADNPEFATLQAEAQKSFKDTVTPFIKDYCTRCHSQNRQRGGINFDPSLKKPGDTASAHLWKQGIAVIKAHDMPPEDAKQPSDEERQKFLAALAKIKYLSSKDPGPFVIRRLTKVEYANTLHDFLGVDPSVANDLPDEVFGEGYLNTLSSLQSEQYLAIANEALNHLLGHKDRPNTKAQKQLFGKIPSAANERSAAKTIAATLARKAYRRPPSNSEIETLLQVFDLARANKLAYHDSCRLMLKAILVSPQFLFITPSAEPQSGQPILPLDDYQLASRLSYFLWQTMPDAELSSLADRGALQDPAVLKAQVKRLLADPRSRALFDGFGAQWLALGDLKSKTFDPAKFPQMTDSMRAAMYDEARLFFESIVRENQSILSLIDSDYTFLNATLAPHYGVDKKEISGSKWRKVKLTDPNRGGILSMPGVLAVTSFPDRTSPVKRGVWVLEQVLGEHIPPPPPNVPALEKQDKQTVANLTLRQRTELHVKDPACANCHKVLDPIGFGLENFDAIGRWRERDDTGGPIDAAGELPGGKRFSSPRELKSILAARTEDIARNVTEKLLAYALCRQLEGYDHIVMDRLMETLAKDGYRMQTLISEIVTSYPFTHRRIEQQLASSHEKKSTN